MIVVNAVGAGATTFTLVVIVAARFVEGAWIVILIIPGVILLFKAIRRHYDGVRAHLREEGPVRLRRGNPPLILIATAEWNRLTDRTLTLALDLSPEVIAVHCSALEGPDAQKKEWALRARWQEDVERPARTARIPHTPRLIQLNAPYRRLQIPLLKLIHRLKEEHPDRNIAVMIPELVKQHWWEYLLYTRRAQRLRAALLAYAGSGVAVISVPWHLAEPKIEQAMDQDEAAEPIRLHGERLSHL
jgi:hypothetical protein